LKNYVQTLFAAGLIFLAFAPQAFSQTRRGTTYTPGTTAYGSSISYGYSNEIITNFTSGNLITEKPCNAVGCKSQTTTMLQGAYLRSINANIQAGARMVINNNGDETLFTLLALGVYNFDTDFKNAFFGQGGIGIYPVLKSNLSGYENKIGFFIGGGKRFPIWDRVNYIPSISLVKKGDLDIGFDIEFLNFSLMF
jgi:hypothetical protein